jgi:hypothetical protein
MPKHQPSRALSDRAFWLEEEAQKDPHFWSWIEALSAFDQEDDIEPLLKLLPAAIRPYVQDLHKRKRLRARQRGPAPTPSYERTTPDALLLMAHEDIRYQIRQGHSVDEAIGYVSKRRRIPLSILANSYKGKRR